MKKAMKSMFRYVVPIDDQPHGIDLRGLPLRVEAGSDGANHYVEFWAESDLRNEKVGRSFQVFGTGHPLPGNAVWRGTTSRTERGLVWHLCELVADDE